MHRTHLPLLKWAQAIYLLVSSSKGISSRTISELIDVSYSTAWHLTHRIRAMMAENTLLLDGIVEVDEMFAGAPPRKLRPSKGKTGRGTDRPLLLVAAERDGNVVTCQIPTHSKDVIGEALDGVLGDQAVIMTDGLPAYIHLGEKHTHLSVLHSAKEYARTDEATGHRVHVNRVESFNNFFRRAILGVWHQISTKHLSRYASETAFWWNHKDISCLGRMEFLVTNGVGRVLTYAFLTEDGKIRVRPLA